MKAFVLFLLSAFALAETPVAATEPALASLFPRGAVAYVEWNGLAGRLRALLDSPLGDAIANHPQVRKALLGPKGRQLALGELMLRGATGLDVRGLLDVLAARQVAIALYPGPAGGPPRALAMARVDPAGAAKVLGGIEVVSRRPRTEIEPAAPGRAALLGFLDGRLFASLDGDLLTLSGDEATIRGAREKPEGSLAGDDRIAAGRRMFAPEPLGFAWIDAALLGGRLGKDGKAKDLGEALALGALRAYLPRAPWIAAALALEPEGGDWRATLRAGVPVPDEASKAVVESFGGTLDPLPFSPPERTVALLRLRRDLSALWSHKDEFLSEAGIAGLLEFETNFGNLMAGMSFIDEFLPNVGGEWTLLATRPEYAPDAPAPEVRLPHFALLYPLKSADALRANLEDGFQAAIGVVSVLSAMNGGKPFSQGVETRNGVRILTAAYRPPSEGELEGMRGLPMRYNFSPSFAILGDWFVLGSTTAIVRDLVDGWGRPTGVAPGVNAGLWIRGPEAHKGLKENFEPLVARNMVEKAHDRAAAEAEIGLLLDLAGRVRDLSLTVEEGRGTLGVTLSLVAGK